MAELALAALRARLDLIVALMIAALCVWRLSIAAGVHLNPDEALHYHLAHQRSFIEAYRANNTNAHPPLFILLLYFLTQVHQAEWFLRLAPLAGYGMYVWLFYRWARLVFRTETALIAAVLAAFSPPVAYVATEVRNYGLMLGFSAAALYFVERAFQQQDSKRMALSQLFAALGILTHYSATLFVAGLSTWALFRIWRRQASSGLIGTWAGGQAAVAAAFGFLYLTHVRQLGRGALAEEARQGWLRSLYFLSGDDPLDYLFRNFKGLFDFLFFPGWIGLLAILIFLTGAGALLRRGKYAECCLVIAPLVWLMAAGLMGLYPFGGSRHCLFAVLAIVPAVAFVLELVAGKRLWLGVVAVLAAVPLWSRAYPTSYQHLPPEQQCKEFAVEAAQYLRSRIEPGGLVITDIKSSMVLCYYWNPANYCTGKFNGHFYEYFFPEIRIVSSAVWALSPSMLVEELKALKKQYGLKAGASVWMFDAGWGTPMHEMLAVQFSGSVLPGLRSFGPKIGVFRIPN